ncbi:MAG: hypothetical protein ACERJ1_08645 [Halodesulfovibrio sp.]|uniref:hypothetical protein n=1 Tax=Halodesulfovibrio sp. TaxID=1912772 RepID=UPI00359EB94B
MQQDFVHKETRVSAKHNILSATDFITDKHKRNLKINPLPYALNNPYPLLKKRVSPSLLGSNDFSMLLQHYLYAASLSLHDYVNL